DTSAAETRRHFDVVAEMLRSDIRSLAELMAISNEQVEGKLTEHGGRITGLEGRVLGLEARVSTLEGGRPLRPRRRPELRRSVPLHDLAQRGAQVVPRTPQMRMHGEGAPEELGRLVELTQHEMAEPLAGQRAEVMRIAGEGLAAVRDRGGVVLGHVPDGC